MIAGTRNFAPNGISGTRVSGRKTPLVAAPNIPSELQLWFGDIARASKRRSSMFGFRRKSLDNNFRESVTTMTSSRPSGEELRALVLKGADPNFLLREDPVPNMGPPAPLHTAVIAKNLDCVKTLLCLGARPDGPLPPGDHFRFESPLMVATRFSTLPILELLAKAGADPNYEATHTTVHAIN
ncbi:hypothetical protein B0T26DRAFT_399911 [Lasiosphaeria miniovina]|uniref:Uncharacterized protein n=1 Tax=Lasiosphaeria miniovina TaxID=1954250 RepID=A0AA40DQ28_9PEZI|nr:uncharacterized protein B0T26DRAFT_399911 [Lasiosphaeria miniovina]KAK0709266.1 hypothetical protein B0T26DRAFT_399911 [Lasiosphaeria miniovina]